MKKGILREITLMNAFLCFSVVMIHLTSSPLGAFEIGSVPHGLVFFLNKVLAFSVPGFIFLSGFKLYGKYEGGKVDLKGFFLGRFLKIVIPYFVSVIIYFLYFWQKAWVTPADLPEYVFLGTLVAHFYYVIIAVQLYLLFPVLNLLFKKFPLILIAITLICTVLFNQFVFFKYSDRFFGAYVFYFILGMAFSRYKPCDKIKNFDIAVIFGYIVTAVVHLGYSYIATVKGVAYENEGLASILYATLAIAAIYCICLKLSGYLVSLHKFAKNVGATSYNIYLYHILIIFFLQYDVYPRFAFSVTEKFVISSVVVFGVIIAYAIIWPKIKEIIKNRIKKA